MADVQGEVSDLKNFLDRLSSTAKHPVLVDCSASPAVATSYAR